MRRGTMLSLVTFCFACTSIDPADPEAALTREQAAVFRAVLEEVTPAALRRVPAGRERRRLETELSRLSRSLRRGNAAALIRHAERVRSAGGHRAHPGVALVLREAEAAARAKLTTTPQ